jgi:hypothetical protein
MAVIVALIGAYWLLDRLIETDREQMQRKVEAMAEGLRSHNLDAVFEHFSDDFRSPQGKNKKELRDFAGGVINSVAEVKVWDQHWESKPERGQECDGLVFRFKLRGVGVDNFYFDCRPVFVYEPGKGWRLKRLKIFKPGTTEALEVPF